MAGELVELADHRRRIVGIAPPEFWDKLAQHPDVVAYAERHPAIVENWQLRSYISASASAAWLVAYGEPMFRKAAADHAAVVRGLHAARMQ